MSKKKEYTKDEVLLILDFAKDKNLESIDLLSSWVKNKSNRIEKEEENGLSNVGIFEHSITTKEGSEIGKVIIFNYTGVGGGWHNDIYEMVEKKYFSDEPHYSFIPGDGDAFYYRLFLTGNLFKDEEFDKWEKQNGSDEFRILKQELPNSELIIVYDVTDEGDSIPMRNELENGRRSEYSFFYDYSACNYYIKNIHSLNFKPSRPIIEQRIFERTTNDN